MQMRRISRLYIVALVTVVACDKAKPATAEDSAFAALQERGRAAMGVDQYMSYHRFTPLPDGGLIELQRDADDSVDVRTIRAHLRHVASRFAQGDFAQPAFVHDTTEVPGTEAMRPHLHEITWRFEERRRGGAIRIRSANPSAVRAIHEFLAFQNRDHRTH